MNMLPSFILLCSCSCCSFGLAFTPSPLSHPAPGKLCILPDSAQVPPFCHAASDLYSLKWLKTTHLLPCHNTFRKQRRKSKSAVMYIPNWLFSVCFLISILSLHLFITLLIFQSFPSPDTYFLVIVILLHYTVSCLRAGSVSASPQPRASPAWLIVGTQ